jgi:hypothetical protein
MQEIARLCTGYEATCDGHIESEVYGSRDTWSSSSVGVGTHGSAGTGEGAEEALVSLEYE